MVNDISMDAISRAEFAGNINLSQFVKLSKVVLRSDQVDDIK
jgi:hypothetical protein